jgi:hypothetical protein
MSSIHNNLFNTLNQSNNPGSSSEHGTNHENMLPKIGKRFNVIMFFIILGFFIISILALFKPSLFTTTNGLTMTEELIAVNISLIVSFILIISGLLIYFIPSLSDIKKFIIQIQSVVYVVLYTIFTILFFSLMPSSIMNQYGFFVTPVTMFISLILFFFGIQHNYSKDFNVNYERIKSVILFLCFIFTLFTYYSSNTGGFVQEFFGSSLIITILLAFFSFLYVIIVLSIPTGGFPSGKQGPTNFLSKFTSFSVYGTISFIIYLIVIVCGVIYLKGGFNSSASSSNNTNSNVSNPYYGKTPDYNNEANNVTSQSNNASNKLNTNFQGTVLDSIFDMPPSDNKSEIEFSFSKANSKNNYSFGIPLPSSYVENSSLNIATGIALGGTGNGSTSFNEGFTTGSSTDSTSSGNQSTLAVAIIFVLITSIIFGVSLIINLFPESTTVGLSNNISTYQRSLLMLFGVILSGLLISWIVYYSQHLTGQTSIISFVLNLFLVIVILILIYKTFVVKLPLGNSNKNGFFSLIINLFLYIPCLFSDLFEALVSIFTGQNYSNLASSVLLIIIAVLLLVAYFELPSLESKIALQGGQQIINKPVNLNLQTPLLSYEDLNGNTDAKYEYGISAWFFIDSMPPNTNPSYSKYTSILNYGNKPNISYNSSENKLKVTMEQISRTITPNIGSNTKKDYKDTTTQEIIYEKEGILLQKWNNIIINYSGGTLDVFLNNELMKSVNGIVPYMKLDSLTCGSENGLMGGICNVIYFKNPITTSQMYYLYNMVKDKTPPIANNSNKTIISVSK